MSDPRMIPAGEAKAMREAATNGPWEPFLETWEDYGPDGEVIAEYEQFGVIGMVDGILDTRPRPSLMDAPNQWEESGEHDNRANIRLAAAAPDLAYTVVEQDADIVDLVQEVNDHHHDLLRVMEERNQQAAQIKRVREVLDKVRSEWTELDDDLTMMRNGGPYEEGVLDTLDRVETWMEEALGDTDG